MESQCASPKPVGVMRTTVTHPSPVSRRLVAKPMLSEKWRAEIWFEVHEAEYSRPCRKCIFKGAPRGAPSQVCDNSNSPLLPFTLYHSLTAVSLLTSTPTVSLQPWEQDSIQTSSKCSLRDTFLRTPNTWRMGL